LSIANLYLAPANFLFLLLSCLNFILNNFFLSSSGLFELAFFLLWVILNWLFLVLRQQSVGAASSLAVIITNFYAGKFDCCFIMIWLLALDAGAAY